MDLLDLLKWGTVVILMILYSIFFFELFDQYLFQSMREKILSVPQMNVSYPDAEL